jgi:hypothetical protein
MVSSLETEARIAGGAIGIGVASGKKFVADGSPGLIRLLDYMPAIIKVRKGVEP